MQSLPRKLEGVELRSFDNTARAAQLVAASDDPGVAAIAALNVQTYTICLH